MIEKFGLPLNWTDVNAESFPELSDKQLHIWWLPLRLDSSQSKIALSLLSDIQRDKYQRRASAVLKQHYLAGRYYLLNLLAAYTDQTPNEILLSYSRLNKPSLSDASLGVEFNFTDTNGYGAFAFSKSRQVGIDIECLQRTANFKAIAERRFTEQELAYVYQDGTLNRQRCLGIWTRKEAFGKATGMGINFKMNQRNLYDTAASDDHQHEYRFQDDEGTHWRCLQLQFGNQFISSVVHEQHQELELKAFKSLQL